MLVAEAGELSHCGVVGGCQGGGAGVREDVAAEGRWGGGEGAEEAGVRAGHVVAHFLGKVVSSEGVRGLEMRGGGGRRTWMKPCLVGFAALEASPVA